MLVIKNIKIYTVLILITQIFGCMPSISQNVSTSPPQSTQYTYTLNEDSSYSDKTIDISIIPIKGTWNAYKGMTIHLKNKSQNDIKIIWNDSYFIKNGEANGGFMFEGIKYTDRNNPKQDTLVFPQTSINKTIYPNNEVLYIQYNKYAEQMGIPTGWEHAAFNSGFYGAYLSIEGDDYKKKVKLLFQISKYFIGKKSNTN